MFKSIVRQLLKPINSWADLADTVATLQKQEEQRIIPIPPKPPLSRIISESGPAAWCKKCGSSMRTTWYGRITKYCIHPECTEYYGKADV